MWKVQGKELSAAIDNSLQESDDEELMWSLCSSHIFCPHLLGQLAAQALTLNWEEGSVPAAVPKQYPFCRLHRAP